MLEESFYYEKFFSAGMGVRIGIHLPDDRFFSDYAEISGIENDRLHIRLCQDLPGGVILESGTEAIINSTGRWSHCRCHILLEKRSITRDLFCRFQGSVIEQQRREFFRLDVFIPLRYSIHKKHDHGQIEEEWHAEKLQESKCAIPTMLPCEGKYKLVRWNGEEILPMWVNLSAGGLRIVMKERLEIDTLLSLEIFLPLSSPRVIRAVGMVLRVKEQELSWDKQGYFSTAMKFHLLDPKDREAIISYIFIEQRNNLQKRIKGDD